MRFVLGIKLDNAAFTEVPDELSNQLLDLAARLQGADIDEPWTGLIRDTNGNTVGNWSIEP